MTCCICLDNLENETIKILNCKHQFHEKCINEVKKKYKIVCPLCRKVTVEFANKYDRFDNLKNKSNIMTKFNEYYKVFIMEIKICIINKYTDKDYIKIFIDNLLVTDMKMINVFISYDDIIMDAINNDDIKPVLFLLCDVIEFNKEYLYEYMQIFISHKEALIPYIDKLLYLCHMYKLIEI